MRALTTQKAGKSLNYFSCRLRNSKYFDVHWMLLLMIAIMNLFGFVLDDINVVLICYIVEISKEQLSLDHHLGLIKNVVMITNLSQLILL